MQCFKQLCAGLSAKREKKEMIKTAGGSPTERETYRPQESAWDVDEYADTRTHTYMIHLAFISLSLTHINILTMFFHLLSYAGERRAHKKKRDKQV